MRTKKIYRIEAIRQLAAQPKRQVRKHLNADALIQIMRKKGKTKEGGQVCR